MSDVLLHQVQDPMIDRIQYYFKRLPHGIDTKEQIQRYIIIQILEDYIKQHNLTDKLIIMQPYDAECTIGVFSTDVVAELKGQL